MATITTDVKYRGVRITTLEVTVSDLVLTELFNYLMISLAPVLCEPGLEGVFTVILTSAEWFALLEHFEACDSVATMQQLVREINMSIATSEPVELGEKS